jgi:hypothetical protein
MPSWSTRVPDQFDDRLSLKDLDGVRVTVEEPLPRGLAVDAIRTAVENQLRAARIRVLGLGDFPTGDPHLRVTIGRSAERSGLVALDVRVDFVQIVFMRRNPQVTFNRAQTWRAAAQVSLAPVAEASREIDRELSRQVDQFIRDYRAENG